MSTEATNTDIYTVTGISPNLIQIEVRDIKSFATDEENQFSIGSYLKITDNRGVSVVAIVKSYRIKDPVSGAEKREPGEGRSFVIDAQPIGFIKDGGFKRGGQQIAIPPTNVEIAKKDILELIYRSADDVSGFEIGALAIDESIRVPIDGDRFFGKHIAVLGSTGSGKSCTVAKIIGEAIMQSEQQDKAGVLNNSHVFIFDIHGEYSSAFPKCNIADVGTLALPYWLMNGEELEEMFIESNEQNSHNQISQFRHAVIENKKCHNPKVDITYDTPVYFSITEVHNYIANMNKEVIGKCENEGVPKLSNQTLVTKREDCYFEKIHNFVPTSSAKADKASNGPFTGEFDRFERRLETKLNEDRLAFLLKPKKPGGSAYKTSDLELILRKLVGYENDNENNVTIIDLAGIPFEETSIVVSLISRLLFEFSFYFKVLKRGDDSIDDEAPLLVVYEEAHKYVPNTKLAKYTSARAAIERIAKEGRKYGISLMIVSQRPSEISDTIFSQCNNFVVMRLTNPSDQSYVNRLLPDTISNVTDNLPALEQREAILIGDATNVPSVIMVDKVDPKPSSKDVHVLTEWRKDWVNVLFERLIKGIKREKASNQNKSGEDKAA
ncbi:MAG: ATP-binding protein [Planctomycetes bacterium]|nr:ATP-binding protein [Planctomycetota bacterium]